MVEAGMCSRNVRLKFNAHYVTVNEQLSRRFIYRYVDIYLFMFLFLLERQKDATAKGFVIHSL